MSSTEVAVTPQRVVGSALVIDPHQNYWTDRQIGVLNQMGVKDASPADLAVFFHQSVRTGLDPFAKQIFMIGRKAKDGDRWVTKQTIQIGIDGFRLIAHRVVDRTGETLGYEDTAWCGWDGVWRDVWLDEKPPAAARVVVLRNGQRYPAIAHMVEYVQTYKDKAGNLVPTGMWDKMFRNQLAKCAEAQALRKAFPQDLSGLYIDEEMQHTHRDDTPRRAEPRRVTANEILHTEPPVIEPDPPAEPEPEPAGPELMRDNQRRKMFALFNDMGMKDRGHRLAMVGDIVGREITTTSELSVDEADKVLSYLSEQPS